jgi:magnesium-transporting ATPase (P-type)
MKVWLTASLIGVLVMGAVLFYGFVWGDFSGEGSQLLAMPWGIVSLIDVYLMFFLFSGWVFYREKSKLVALLWFVLTLVLGALTAYFYTFLALIRSRGDWQRFWLGRRG